MWWHFVTLYTFVSFHNFFRINRKFFVWVNYHTKKARICLQMGRIKKKCIAIERSIIWRNKYKDEYIRKIWDINNLYIVMLTFRFAKEQQSLFFNFRQTPKKNNNSGETIWRRNRMQSVNTFRTIIALDSSMSSLGNIIYD